MVLAGVTLFGERAGVCVRTRLALPDSLVQEVLPQEEMLWLQVQVAQAFW